jgi:hypothetical protein
MFVSLPERFPPLYVESGRAAEDCRLGP